LYARIGMLGSSRAVAGVRDTEVANRGATFFMALFLTYYILQDKEAP
jgi:hypothetical protein